MNIIVTLFVCILVCVILYKGIDFTRFVVLKKEQQRRDKVDGLQCHAGGVLFVQGGKTYYNMPNGVRRIIAEYAMDLTPGSPDMMQFTECMETARREHNAEERRKRVQAKKAMVEVAKEVAK